MRRFGPALLLAAYGSAFAVAAFGDGLPAFDDHPGQYFRLWHALERSVRTSAWTADWNPDWWGGYPELQFYPPGFAILGAVIRVLGLWQPSVELVYQLLCGVVLLLPALATFLLLARVVEDGWLALPPAFVVLTLSAGLRGGVEESLRWGMLTTRLSLGFLPLFVLALRPWIEAGRLPIWAPLTAAAVVLSHPANTPAVLAIFAIAAFLAYALRPRRRTLGDALAVAALGAALSAFWTLPLLVRREWLVPLTWGELTLAGLFGEIWARPVLLAIAAAAPLAWIAVLLRRRPFDALLAVLPIGLFLVLVADIALFARGLSPIEPARVVDALVLSTLSAAGLGVGVLLARLTSTRKRMTGRPVLALIAVALVALFGWSGSRGPTGEPTLTLWPTGTGWPHLDTLSRERDLPRLWAALRDAPDRVLFATSALRLGEDPAWYAAHSHVLSLAPLFTGREIVHGTFTHPGPLAARFYTGSATPPARLDTLVEQLDGERLLGQPWERLSAESFEAFARRLRVATVVVPTADVTRARFLAASYFPAHEAAGFTVFERRDRATPPGSPGAPWPKIERITHRRYRVLVSPSGGVWIPTGVPAYPLWQVKSAAGRLPMRADPWGLLEFRVPLDVFEAELVYSEGGWEWGALAVTLVGGLAWLAWSWPRHDGKSTRRPKAGASALARRRR